MYDSFEKAVKKKHKERRLRSAMESQANYETNEEEIGKKIQGILLIGSERGSLLFW